ncbi:GvpL/GvpF family gas vesicle protein [Streptomyces sp. NPDC001904]|uniref:GvpL/GvpF family gas vesicle protein n=1 Tax=Streptomyces sp. NPDC001904 TaxID=3154531 RepID=UPI003317D8FB
MTHLSNGRTAGPPGSDFSPSAPTLVYVFAVAQDNETLQQRVLELDTFFGSPRLIRNDDGLAALVADVPRADFEPGVVEAQLEDLDRLEELARAHHECVETAAAFSTLLPLRMMTVYVDEAGVLAMLDDRAGTFRRALHLLAEHVEMGIKVYADPDAAQESLATPGATRPHSPGRDYLKRRRAQRDRHASTYRAAGEAAQHAHARATAFARAHVSHRLQGTELTARREQNLVNDAYLVARTDLADFAAAVTASNGTAPGVSVEVTGPWVPYSFTEWAQANHTGQEARAAGGDCDSGPAAPREVATAAHRLDRDPL